MTWNGILHANALNIPLADESVHMVVTSPPYYGLRKYTIPYTVWDGDPTHEHVWDPEIVYRQRSNTSRWNTTLTGTKDRQIEANDVESKRGNFCGCGAWFGQLGMEPNVELYVQHMVQVFEEIRRVLRSDGVCFMNLGDSSAQSGGRGMQGSTSQRLGRKNVESQTREASRVPPAGFKPKDLMMIPHRVAIALQGAGWWVRNDIVWEKVQCMPESIRDRCTRSHEYLFHLAKSETYFWDWDAIKEPASEESHARYSRRLNQMKGNGTSPKLMPAGFGVKSNDTFKEATKEQVQYRNKRTVWTIPTSPYSESHFATFPPALVSPCIKVGTSEKGVCPQCGAPYTRQVEPSPEYSKYLGESYHDHSADLEKGRMQPHKKGDRPDDNHICADYVTVGWAPGCDCEAGEPVPAIVFDPFHGSGTTGMVSEELNRRWIGLDLGYHHLQKKRVKNVQRELVL